MKWRKSNDKNNQFTGNELHYKRRSANFPISEMEFVEVLFLEKSMFLHGVRIVGDSYGEDIYLPVGVVTC